MDFGISNQIQAFSSCPNEMLWARPRHPQLTDQPAVDYSNPDTYTCILCFTLVKRIHGVNAMLSVVDHRRVFKGNQHSTKFKNALLLIHLSYLAAMFMYAVL